MIRIKLIIATVILTNSAYSQDWEFVLDLDDSPRCFYSDDLLNSLIIGGEFTKSNFLDVCAILIKSEDTTSPLGCGFDCICESNDTSTTGLGPVLSIAKFNNEVYATGLFRRSNQVLVNGLAKFDSTNNTWLPVLSGLQLFETPGSGRKLKIIGNKLFVLGSFDSCAGIDANSIAYLEDGIWHSFYDFPTFGNIGVSVFDIEEYLGEFYVIGNFISSGNDSSNINRIVKFDGNAWVSVAEGIPGGLSGPFKLIVFQDKLFVVGRMSKNSGDPGDGIAAWDGSTWLDVGGGLNGNNNTSSPTNPDAVVFNNRLYVVGDFTVAGGQPINNIAAWDGINWCGLGVLPNTFDNRVSRIGVHNGSLIIGGGFRSINGDSTLKYIARYVGPDVYEPCGNATSVENEINMDAFEIYPNPASNQLNIRNSSLKGTLQVSILDATGRLIQNAQFSGIGTHTLNLSGLAPGIYFCRVIQGGEVVVKVVKVE